MNKLVDDCNNSYHHPIGKNLLMMIILLCLKKLNPVIKLLKCKVNDRVKITMYKNVFSKRYTNNWSKDIFVIDFMLKTNPWMYETKDLNGETITGNF